MYNYPAVNIGLCSGFFTLSFTLFIHNLGEQFLSISNFQVQTQTLALNNNINWLASPTSANGIIAIICIFSCLIFFLLQFAGLKTKKIMMGITGILASIFFIEMFFIFLTPEQSALNTGWYRGAVEFFGQEGVSYLSWLLHPLMIIALAEQIISLFSVLGMATGICLGLSFGVDYVRSKVGI